MKSRRVPFSGAVLPAILIVMAFLGTGVAWALASPVGSSPDDDYHNTSIYCPPPVEESGCDLVRDQAGHTTAVLVPEMVYANSGCYAFKPTESGGACTSNLSEEKLGPSQRFDEGAYPGPYYRVMHAVLVDDVTRSILLIRVLNVVLAVAMFGLLILGAGRQQRLPLALAVLATIVPLGLFVIGSVNPSAWSVIGISASGLALLAAGGRATARRPWLLVLVSVVGALMASVSRADSGPYLIATAIGLLPLTLRRGVSAKGTPQTLAAHAMVTAIGAIALYRSLGAVGFSENASGSSRLPLDVFTYNVLNVPSLVTGGWGGSGLSWMDTGMPSVTSIGALSVAVTLLAVGLTSLSVRKILTVTAVISPTVVLPMYVWQRQLLVVGEGVQPRYVLPMIPIVLGCLLVGREAGTFVRFSKGQLLYIAVALSVAQSAALLAVIRRFTVGSDLSYVLPSDVEWWWSRGPRPRTVWILGSTLFTAAVFGAVWTTWRGQTEEPSGPSRTVPSP